MNVQHLCISNPDILDWFCVLTFHYDLGFCTGFHPTIEAGKDRAMNKRKAVGRRKQNVFVI